MSGVCIGTAAGGGFSFICSETINTITHTTQRTWIDFLGVK